MFVAGNATSVPDTQIDEPFNPRRALSFDSAWRVDEMMAPPTLPGPAAAAVSKPLPETTETAKPEPNPNKSCSPKKTSPKKTSPKKTSPKKTAPKKTSPEKTTPKKTTALVEGIPEKAAMASETPAPSSPTGSATPSSTLSRGVSTNSLDSRPSKLVKTHKFDKYYHQNLSCMIPFCCKL